MGPTLEVETSAEGVTVQGSPQNSSDGPYVLRPISFRFLPPPPGTLTGEVRTEGGRKRRREGEKKEEKEGRREEGKKVERREGGRTLGKVVMSESE